MADTRDDGEAYNAVEIANMTGVSARQVRYWEEVGYITSQPDVRGSGHTRRFSTEQVGRVRVIAYLVDVGLSLDAAANIAEEYFRRVRIRNGPGVRHEYRIGRQGVSLWVPWRLMQQVAWGTPIGRAPLPQPTDDEDETEPTP